MSVLEGGQLRQRVKRGEVSAVEARRELLTLQRQGNVVSESAIRWLGNFDPRRHQKEDTEEKPQQKQRRRKRRRQR